MLDISINNSLLPVITVATDSTDVNSISNRLLSQRTETTTATKTSFGAKAV